MWGVLSSSVTARHTVLHSCTVSFQLAQQQEWPLQGVAALAYAPPAAQADVLAAAGSPLVAAYAADLAAVQSAEQQNRRKQPCNRASSNKAAQRR